MIAKNVFILFMSIASVLLLFLLTIKIATYYSPSFISKADDLLKHHEFQGAVLIAKKGKILLSKGYGFANEEHQITNTPDTVFRIGSITKQFTAIALLQLQEEEKLNVGDPISKYLPDYPNGDQITLHHLLSHTSGIPSITDFPNLQDIQRHPTTINQLLDYFKNCPLNFKPGTNCDYSDSGYILLGAIIEAISRKSYEDQIQTKILDPLHMHSTYYDHHHAIIPRRAHGYTKDSDGKLLHSPYIDMSFPHAAGGLATTVSDLYKLDRALKENNLLSKENTDLLFTIHETNQEHSITYGYGFFIGPQNSELEQADNSIVGHYGTIEGFRAASFRYLDDDLTIIMLSNVENTRINTLHLAIAQIYRSSWRPHAIA